MEERKKIVLGWLAFAFVIFHTIGLCLSAAPDRFVSDSVRELAMGYTSDVFSSRWNMFVPCPVLDSKIEVNYFFDGEETGWVRPMKDALEIHQKWRMTHHAELALGESNLLYWVDVDVRAYNLPYDSEWSDKNYSDYRNGYSRRRVRNFIYGTSMYKYKKEPDSAYVHCAFENVVSGETGTLKLPVFRWK